ncbi:GTPase-activating protein RacGAP84C-like [Venturia canescens]|uniref:GTPase-activating protein RacGAP84C-like n=1 Tax=Venturia canescens TaxID=32260 RepID=UPI001C9CB6D2|nr:GTPase-activating protein RacGAP84C-like [Venturia canescens]
MASTLDSTKPLGGNIANYVPEKLPYVPPLVTACIKEIELLSEVGMSMYKENGDLAIAKVLVREYRRSKKVPDLKGVDIHTLESTLRLFLASLSEPLIIEEFRDPFVTAALMTDKKKKDAALSEAIILLPAPNLHTLSYLIHHLRFISKLSSTNHYNRLAVVFGRILVAGRSRCLASSLYILHPEDQEEVVQSLLEMDVSYDSFLPFKSQDS